MCELTPLEQERQKRNAKIPKPNVPVKCPRCDSLKKETLFNRNAKLDFYWRYYRCKDCNENYWCGVRHSDQLTVFTIHTPRLTRVNAIDMMTGNLRNILPEGHEAVTAEYNQFLPNGKLPRNVLMAKLDAEESKALNAEVTTPSNEEDIATIYYEEFIPLLNQQGLTYLSAEQTKQLFDRWLAVTYPNMKEE